MNRSYVILGSGIAAVSAIREIRSCDQSSQITMISQEKELPYTRPLLSKTWFRTLKREGMFIRDEAWYDEQKVKRIQGAVIDHADLEKHAVYLQDGQEIYYDKGIYALGASCFMPPFKGKDKAGVFMVRTISDFNQIRSRLALAENAVVIGGGVIGLEMAWELKQTGCNVTILEAGPRLMGRLLDPQSAGVLTEKIENAGIPAYAGVQIEELTGEEEVNGVRLADGRWFPAQLVIVSCGVRANIAVASGSGLECDRGVLVNDHLWTSSDDWLAAGDCIQWKQPNPGLWNYSARSGEVAGWNLVHDEHQYRSFVPLAEPVILSAMGTSLFSIGNISEEGEVEIKVTQERKTGRDIKFKVNRHEGDTEFYEKRFFRNGVLCGAVLIGNLEAMMSIRAELEHQV